MRKLNIATFTNQNEISKHDFEALVKSEELEVYTLDAIKKYIDDTTNLIEKGEEGGELSSEDKEKINIAKSEISNLNKIIVVDNIAGEIVKVPFYIQKNKKKD